MTVYISIGNSDDKLSQAEWSSFYSKVSLKVRDCATVVYGQWVSEPASAWQNACWCVDLELLNMVELRRALAVLAAEYHQDSIAWAYAPVTDFIEPRTGS